jgi:CRISPR-associated protein Cst2
LKTPIYSLSIAARAILDTHSLNNEGGEGNQIQTRMLDILDHNGILHNVNAISGDMLKHIQTEHLFMSAREQGFGLCAGCQRFSANRINADETWMAAIKEKSDVEAIDSLLTTCVMDDLAGILVTTGGRSLPRKSVIEFGWVLGLPETTHTDSYFHVKYANERSDAQRERDATRRVKENRETKEKTGGGNLQQAIFHRPTSSGIYAFVCNVELARIGYNDIAQRYTLSEEERLRRGQLLLESLLYTFIQLNGAMRSTQLPHLVSLEGVISWSNKVQPAPLVSPLMGGQNDRETYRSQTAAIAKALGNEETVQTVNFDSLASFTEEMSKLQKNAQPFTLRVDGSRMDR